MAGKAKEAFLEDREAVKQGAVSNSLVYEEPSNKGIFKSHAVGPTEVIPMDLIMRLQAIQDKELKRFLNFIGIPVDADTTTESLKGRLKLAGIIMQHIVTDIPKINGFYFFEREVLSNEFTLLCIISDPFYEDGKVKIVRRVPE